MDIGKVNGMINIPASIDNDFFRFWLEFLLPYHGLTPREMDIAASFLKQRHYLSRAIRDNAILDKVTMSEDTKHKIMEECKITPSHFQVIMGKLRKSGFITDGKINPKFIPKNIEDGDTSCKLLLYFDLNAGDN